MLGGGRFLCKRVDSLPKVISARSSLRQCNSTATSKETIVIPKRIERGPTDILQALASTVYVDPTAFHYKFHDDPYCYPYSAIDKKVYALAKESGRKSAEWIVRENPKFFSDKLADPPIKAFEALTLSAKEPDLSEEGLLNAIQERNVESAIEIYKTLKSKQEDVQKSTKQSLLELVCFFNSENKPDLDFEEKWLEGFLGKAGSELPRHKYWKKESFAESLFEEMDSNCPLALSAIIQGKLRHMESGEAFKLFEEARSNRIVLPVSVYNAVLSQAQFIIPRRSEIIGFIKKILKDMISENVKPNLGTLNGALKSLSKTYFVDFSAALMKEFMKIGVEPSLGSYGYLFQMIGNLNPQNETFNSHKSFAEELFSEIEGKEHEILHPADFTFFINAMSAFTEGSLKVLDLFLRLHDMYKKPSNRKFIVRGADDHGFYKLLLLAIFQTKPIDFAMSFYRQHVFTLTSPEAKAIKEILSVIKDNLTPEYLHEIWKDLPLVRYKQNRPVLAKILTMLEDFTDETSLKIFHEAAITYFNAVKDQFHDGDEDEFPNLLMALLKNEDEEMLAKVVEFINDKELRFKNLNESTVEGVFEFAFEKKNVPFIVGTLRMASEEDVTSLEKMAEKALPLLTGRDETWANSIIQRIKKSKKQKSEETEKDTDSDSD